MWDWLQHSTLSVWMGVASGQKLGIQLIPQHPVIRGSVTLTVTGITGGDILSFFWNKGADTSVQNQILVYIPFESDPVQLNGPKYHNRVRAFPNASLLISSLERTDEGDYTVQVQTDIAQQASVTLTVYGAVYVNAHALQSSQYEMTMPGNQEKRGQESVYQELTHKDGSIYNTIAGANRNY
ncbi:carcinoembryonic antigen-related cell adhesion molecule 19-like [Hyperolius riggenbachi]|uniref:carcinoembryonic antigen-related cell adhesion molecule 19-like n=1 Tax=Hyperolius riggenbachi TaxID=752182 RepID=UPI0035A2F264